MKKIVLNSPKLLQLKKERRKHTQIKFSFFIFLIIFLFISLIFISRLNIFILQNINIKGNTVIDTEKIKKVIDNDLKGYYLYFIPKNNVFLYPKDKIKQDLSTQLKRIQNISFINKDTENNNQIFNKKNLEVDISERKALYTWCGKDSIFEINTSNTSIQEKCYFMDNNGYIFDEAPYFSGQVYFKFYGNIQNTENPLGIYFSQDIFSKLISFKENLEKIGLKPSAMLLSSEGKIKIYLMHGKNSQIYPVIIFKENNDFQKIEENLDVALNTEPLKTDFINKYSSLLYIDLSINNKVFYKFK